MITVHVKVFGHLRHQLPCLEIGEAMAVEIAPGTTIRGLAEQLELPTFKFALVNGVAEGPGFALRDQDEVALIPAAAGG